MNDWKTKAYEFANNEFDYIIFLANGKDFIEFTGHRGCDVRTVRYYMNGEVLWN